jgi:cbb3-type cytochrome oxidase maturation protein
MTSLFGLIPLAVLLLALAVWAFFWAVSSGQFDNLDTAALRILLDSEDHADD